MASDGSAVYDEVLDIPHQGRAVASQACDGCRLRKVRCILNPSLLEASMHSEDHPEHALLEASVGNEDSNRCVRCSKLKIACTFDLPSKIRGPKRKRRHDTVSQEQEQHSDLSSTVSPMAPSPHDLFRRPPFGRTLSGAADKSNTNLGLSLSNPRPRSTSQLTEQRDETWPVSPSLAYHSSPTSHPYHLGEIGPQSLVSCIVSDFLDILYPLMPLVHRPTFIREFARQRDAEDIGFRGLVIAMIGSVIGLLPSKFAEYKSHPFPIRAASRKDLVTKCWTMLMGFRGPRYYDEVSFQKWTASCLMYIAMIQIGEQNLARMIDCEAMQVARLLKLQEISQYQGLNPIETQLRKKGFWMLFYGYAHSQLQYLRNERLNFLDPTMLLSIHAEDLMPLEVDDEMIFEDRVLPHKDSEPSLTTALNLNSKLFWTAIVGQRHQHSTGPCPCVRHQDPASQVQWLTERLSELKYMLDSVPSGLRQWATFAPLRRPSDTRAESVRQGQFESLRANIHVTHLWLQSIMIDQLDSLMSRSQSNETGTSTPLCPKRQALWTEREDISRQMLHLLHNIPYSAAEPNGLHFVYKIRDVAIGLLACPFDPTEPASKRASGYVRQFTEILARLDTAECVSTVSLQTWVDTDRVKGYRLNTNDADAWPSPWR